MPNLIPPSPQLDIDSLEPFTKFCCTIGMMPSSYTTSMTYEEQLMWLCKYLQDTVIPTINNNGECVTELQNLFVQLANYVDNYFADLDVQQEINNKLDEMALDGTLMNLIAPYLQPFIDEQNTTIENAITSQNSRITAVENMVTASTNINPLVANSLSDMTDTTRIYVLSSSGQWYYYDGSDWTVGGNYISMTNFDEFIDDFQTTNATLTFKNKLMRKNVVVNSGKTIDFANNIVSLSNFQAKLSDSATTSITNPFRIRYDNGTLMFKALEWLKYSNFNQSVIFFFDINGDHMRNDNLNNTDIEGSIISDIPQNAYYCCIKYFNNTAFADMVIPEVKMQTVNDAFFDSFMNNFSVMDNSFKYKNLRLKHNITLNENKSFSGNINMTTIDNMAYSDNSNCDATPLIRLKYDDGTPIISKWNWKNMPASPAYLIYYFDKYGVATSRVTFNNASNTIPADAYYCIINYFKNLGKDFDTYFEPISVQWLSNNDIYYVGSENSDDYSSLYACLDALKNNENNKIIYVKSGTYDLVSEIKALKGDSFLTSISSTDTWQNVNVLVPKNTKIVGIGNVVLNYLPEDNEVSSYAMDLISPINVTNEVTIENIIINCKNCRYGVHDESGTSELNYYKNHNYKNVKIYFTGSNGYGQAFGSGFSHANNFNFDDCIFSSTRNNPFSIHNGYVPSADSSNAHLYSGNMNFNNCKFIKVNDSNASELLLINAEQSQQLYINVNISNCYFKNGKIALYSNSAEGTFYNAYKLIVNNSNVDSSGIVIRSNVNNNLTPEFYNSLV